MQHCMWTPGNNMAVITRNGVMVIEEGYGALSREFWTMLEGGIDLGTLLQTLTSACGNNLAALPSFVALVPEAGGIHVAVRGAFELAMETDSGTVVMTSGNVITWEEKRIDGMKGWKISAPVTSLDADGFESEEYIVSSAIIPISTLSYGTMVASYPSGRHVNTDDVAEDIKETNTDTDGDTGEKISPELSGAEDTGPEDTGLEDTGSQVSGSEDSSSSEVSAPKLNDAPVETVLDEDPASEEKIGHTLNEDQIHLTRAYTDEEDLSALNHEVKEDTLEDIEDLSENGVDGLYTSVVASPAVNAVGGQDFSDLFSEHTRRVSVEDAAVRHVRNDDEPFAIPTMEQAECEGSEIEEGAPVIQTDAVESGFIPPPPMSAAENENEVPTPSGAFFIDSVPRSLTSAGEPASNTAAEAASVEGIHDGHTVRTDKMSFLREQLQSESPMVTDTQAQGDAPMVVALLCTEGHPNPTHVQSCRICEGDMTDQSTTVPRPSLGSLHFSTGEIVALDRDVVIGRRPRYTPQQGRPEAHLVPVPSPNQEISRTHCEVRIDGWEVRVRDMGSNNGTFLIRQGQSPVRLTDSAPALLRPGDILDLGDAVSVRMEA